MVSTTNPRLERNMIISIVKEDDLNIYQYTNFKIETLNKKDDMVLNY